MVFIFAALVLNPDWNIAKETEIGMGTDKGLRGPYDPAARDFIPCIPAGEPA